MRVHVNERLPLIKTTIIEYPNGDEMRSLLLCSMKRWKDIVANVTGWIESMRDKDSDNNKEYNAQRTGMLWRMQGDLPLVERILLD
ncbi:hypothetical protein F2Q69_00020506 [Brassica cretica]|uniref:Uncharacterized protein n=1 Tax=Brassica cretica TaxID=69181 RepID=A0A8S9Q6Z8_BRACR|nr:hypothetical protein F2Q69_00020506 [Brassica cretica]